VGRVARLECVGDQGALQVFVLVASDLDRDAGVGVLELCGHLLPESLQGIGCRVVPPRDGGVAALASLVSAACCESERHGGDRRYCGDSCGAGSVHRRTPLESFDYFVESDWDVWILRTQAFEVNSNKLT